jgi:hypothetical protein
MCRDWQIADCLLPIGGCGPARVRFGPPWGMGWRGVLLWGGAPAGEEGYAAEGEECEGGGFGDDAGEDGRGQGG